MSSATGLKSQEENRRASPTAVTPIRTSSSNLPYFSRRYCLIFDILLGGNEDGRFRTYARRGQTPKGLRGPWRENRGTAPADNAGPSCEEHATPRPRPTS